MVRHSRFTTGKAVVDSKTDHHCPNKKEAIMPADPNVINNPANLFANVPGVLGFYPEESVVLLCFDLVDSDKSRYQLGPVLRVDIEDVLRLHFTPQMTSDLILALIVSRGDPAGGNIGAATTFLAESLHIDTEAIWHTTEISEDAPLTLLWGQRAADQGSSWRLGTIPPVHTAQATQDVLGHGRIIDLSRDEATSDFIPADLIPADRAVLDDAVTRRLHQIDYAVGSAQSIVQSLIAELRELLHDPRTAITPDSLTADQVAVAIAAFDADHEHVRDLAMGEIIDWPGTGAAVSLVAARNTNSTTTRANALCAYAAAAHVAGASSKVGFALDAAKVAANDHTLTTLLAYAHVHGVLDDAVSVVRQQITELREKYGIA